MSPIIQSLANASAYGYRSFAAAVTDTGAYFPLQVVTVGSAGAADVTFTNIPSTYSHLQIRATARNASSGYVNIFAQFNSDTASNYNYHFIQGDGSSVIAGNDAPSYFIAFRVAQGGSGANVFGTGVCDILDYANTNKYKTVRSLTGFDNNGNGDIFFFSGLWRSTSAITSIKLYAQSGNLAQYSQIALYGIKGA